MVLWPMIPHEMSITGKCAVQKQRTTVTSHFCGCCPSWAPLSPADLAFSPSSTLRTDPKGVVILKPSEVVAWSKSCRRIRANFFCRLGQKKYILEDIPCSFVDGDAQLLWLRAVVVGLVWLRIFCVLGARYLGLSNASSSWISSSAVEA